ncbi:hypothetical protein MKC79_09695 [[Clostridium] innocuum]|nr:hypothetical protein [[Clostridium] innocuum]
MIIKVETKADFKKLDGISYRNMAIMVMDFLKGYEIRIFRNSKTVAVFEVNHMTQEDLTAIAQYIRLVVHITVVYSDSFYKSLAII